jgi:hypothetical protein
MRVYGKMIGTMGSENLSTLMGIFMKVSGTKEWLKVKANIHPTTERFKFSNIQTYDGDWLQNKQHGYGCEA